MFMILLKSLNFTYMVLYMHSIPLYLAHLIMILKKNLNLRAKLSNFLDIIQKKHISFVLGRVYTQAFPSILLFSII